MLSANPGNVPDELIANYTLIGANFYCICITCSYSPGEIYERSIQKTCENEYNVTGDNDIDKGFHGISSPKGSQSKQ